MPGSCNDAAERLYLQKDASGDISVPCADLEQHQIDGVRYLFNQHKKEKLGVIVNFPPGCGNSVQVAIFISAICEKLKKPVLILYDTDEEKQAWLERFAKWTNVSNEIEVDATNAFLKKQIFLKNIADIGTFYRRSWGIVVVKSDNFKNIFRKCQLKVDFKIWITAQDFQKDKEMLRLVYTWINPTDKLLQQCIDQTPAVFKEDATNQVLLDLLLQDFLFTRRNLRPFGTYKRKYNPDIQPVLRLSAKNKDATGTKIKRSKKTPVAPTASTIRIESVTSLKSNANSFESSNVVPENSKGDNVTSCFPINIDRTEKEEEESKMDVESFIRDNDPLKSDCNLNSAIRRLDNVSHINEANSPKDEESNTDSSLDFDSAIADIIRAENKVNADECNNSTLKVIIPDKNDCGPDLVVEEVKETTELNKIDSERVIQKGFYVSAELADQNKTEKKSSDEERNGKADQKGKLEVSTIVMKETDSSFDSKMKELEERALKKFKGSVLDNIF